MVERQTLMGAQVGDLRLAPPANRTTSQIHEQSIARADGLNSDHWRSLPDYLTGNDGKTWVEDGIDGARLVREPDGDVPAMGGCLLTQIVAQHHIQPVVTQSPGDLLRRGRVIIVGSQPPCNRR